MRAEAQILWGVWWVVIYRDKILDHLRELAQVEDQRRLWLASSGEISSFTEAMCGLFDDTGLGDALQKGDAVFNAGADRTLRELSAAVSTVDGQLPPGALIDHPLMGRGRALASKAVGEIQSQLCPVSGFDFGEEFGEPPWSGDSPSDEICLCCGIQFGYTDFAGGDKVARQELYKEWRERWIMGGMRWTGVGASPPERWDPVAQLRRIGVAV
jgi:hypothetical protein